MCIAPHTKRVGPTTFTGAGDHQAMLYEEVAGRAIIQC